MPLNIPRVYDEFVKLEKSAIRTVCVTPFYLLTKIDKNMQEGKMNEKEATYHACKEYYDKYYNNEQKELTYRHPLLKKCFDILENETNNYFDFLCPSCSSGSSWSTTQSSDERLELTLELTEDEINDTRQSSTSKKTEDRFTRNSMYSQPAYIAGKRDRTPIEEPTGTSSQSKRRRLE